MTDGPHFYERVKDYLDLQDALGSDGKITYRDAVQLLQSIVQAGNHFILAIVDSQEHFDTLVKDCERLYDEYVKDLDIVFIPESVETFVDDGLRALIEPALKLTRATQVADEPTA